VRLPKNIHPTIKRFLGRTGKVTESWYVGVSVGFRVVKQTLNGSATYARIDYAPGGIHTEARSVLRTSFYSRLHIDYRPIDGELFYEVVANESDLHYDMAANAYEAALFLSGNMPIATPLPFWFDFGIPPTSLHLTVALEGLQREHHLRIGYTKVDNNNVEPKRLVVIHGDIDRKAKKMIESTFGPSWKSSPFINSRNVLVIA